MADAKKSGLALLLLGGKKPKSEAEPDADDAPNEARKAASEGVLAAITDKDAEALDEALSAWFDARGSSKA